VRSLKTKRRRFSENVSLSTMHSDFAFRFTLLALVIIDLSIPVYFRRKAAATTGRSLGGHRCRFFMAERLLTAACYCGIVAYAVSPRLMAWSQVALPTAVRAVGAALAGLALTGFFWAFRHLGPNLLPDTPSADRALVTTGPYRRVRHPLYSAWVVLLTGYSLITSSWAVAITGLAAMATVVRRIPTEEQGLQARFGDAYRDYAARTGRFLPRLRRPAD
jgi:protein-S-isoprenylcysteine O-methyltransferase Ste14